MPNPSLIHIFGEVLFAHFPDGSRVPGGAPFNVAWHLHAFGQSPRLISRIGDDPEGQEIVQLMRDWRMRPDALQTDPTHPTGSVQVSIDRGEPRYEIVVDCAYDFIDASLLADKTSQGIFYHGSLAIRTPASLAALQTAKDKHRGKIFIDVNLRPPWWEAVTLQPLLHDAEWVKLNEDELLTLCPGHPDLETAMQAFFEEFNLEILFTTRGAQGTLAYDQQHGFISVKPPSITTVVDTVGAGDAFASILLLGLNEQWPLPTTLERAQAFAGALVSRRGATIGDKAFYRTFANQWGTPCF
ncbi:carbohydrate kinase [Methylomicrobium sp. Wu6]|uniref:carbohydrate kinase family protein n=1 Tax=Methylomicrobium sp. Wu6 TaxID=3107928 RepID=UPI002DD67CAE|nr:carbohydrate kinase [Methylomicrobium sp. Wu6]MEC4750425.1 carbohydrate kinase [Methylomicrobium sp. Wu6]